MRVAMRQLLSRKNNQKMSDAEPCTSEPGVLPRRVFPHPPTVTIEGLKPDEDNADLTDPPNLAGDDTFRPAETREVSETTHANQRLVSERSKYVSSKSGPPRVLAGTTANKKGATYHRCEDEPIHTPGTIQSFGALLGLKYNDHGHLRVRVASENCRKILGYGPEQLFELSSFLDILKDDVRQEMVARIEDVLADVGGTKEETRLDIFQMILTFPFEPEIALWCAIHLAPSHNGLVICEFEKYSDAFHLEAKILPITQPRPTGVDVSPEDFLKSTTSGSDPLPVLRIARQKENKHFSSLDVFNAMAQAQKQMAACISLERIFEVVVGIVSELTCFHRVMFYRFDSQMNGCIEAELLNPQASSDIFRGLHFPASDIPKQAQQLYKINRIRLLHDRDAETARLVCRNKADFEQPLDLTHAYLRSISPVHCKYLKNMGVRSTMSISIVIDNNLWGLIACHGYGDNGILVSLPIRELCRNIGECAATNIQRLLMVQRLEARRAPMANPSSLNPTSFMSTSSSDLLKLVDADFALLSIDDKTRAIGMLDPYQEALAIISYLQSCRFTSIRSSHNIKADFPGLSYSPGLNAISGLLIIPLNVKEGNHFLVFFRKTLTREVNWAGNPYDKKFKGGSNYLEPRSSFKRWGETVTGTSKEWTEDQLDTASVLAMLYSRMIDIWQQKATATESAQMALIRASSNEVRPPLDAIVNYLDMALDSEIDDKTRDILGKAQDASISLINVMDDLLRLTEEEDGSYQPLSETFNLRLTALRVLEVLQKEAQRKAFDLTISVHDKLPATVKGNGDRFKQVLVYFTNNAFKCSTSVKVNVLLVRTKEETSTILLQIKDNGPGMSEAQLANTVREFQRFQDENSPSLTTDTTPSLDETNGGLSVDVAVICQYVRSLGGQIQVTSELGKGTIFSVELPFEHSLPTKPRKLRNLFLPALRSPKGPPPSLAPPLRSPRSFTNDGSRSSRSPRNDTAFQGSFSPRSSSLSPMEKRLPPMPADRQFSVSPPKGDQTSTHSDMTNDTPNSLANLNVLIAEHDPVSLRMLDERLSKWGHTVDIACNGQECHDRFAAKSSTVDVILMDLKMPVVDGVLSTRMIRFLEKESNHRNISNVPNLQNSNNRVAIIAVSSSLYEESRFDYIQSGFDGWILKPIDFRKLDLILQGVKNPKFRRDCLYTPGQWERGGWFLP